MTNDTAPAIEIPDATAEPAAYVRALIGTLGDRDPLEVYETTAGEVRRLCQGLSVRQWNVPLAAREWSAPPIAGPLIAADTAYAFRSRRVLTEARPSYP